MNSSPSASTLLLAWACICLCGCGAVDPDSRAGRLTQKQISSIEGAELAPSELSRESIPSKGSEHDFRVVGDIVYYTGPGQHDEKHLLDLYLPAAEEPFPLIHFVHGGAWFFGHKNQRIPFLGSYDELGRGFARRGIGVAISNYRLSPDFKHPAHIQDVAAAWAWLLKNIEGYGGDPDRMYLMGQSAGGHLVSLLATDRSQLEALGVADPKIQGVISMSGIYDLGTISGKGSEPAGFVRQAFGSDNQVLRMASPIAHVDSSLPPFYLITAERDPLSLRVQAAQFAQALEKEGLPYEFVIIPRKNHFNSIGDIGKRDDATTQMIAEYVLKAASGSKQ